jgi:hypothetical protein
MRIACLLFGIVAVTGVALPTAAAAASDRGQSVTGTVELAGGSGTEGTPCSGTGELADVKSGAKVTLRDLRGRVVGRGALGDGTWEAVVAGSTIVNCELPFAFSVAPAKRYVVEVGTRQVATVTQKALRADGWVLTVAVA